MQTQFHTPTITPFSGAVATMAVRSKDEGSITMTSLELVDFINMFRKARAEKEGGEFPSKEFPELRHDNFMAKVTEVLGIKADLAFKESYQPVEGGRSYPCYRFPKREACLMAMSYSYELQAAVYDRMTALEEEIRGIQMPRTLPEALRLAADLAEKAERAAIERDEAIRTKAQIGDRREATAMNTASQAVKRVHALEDELGMGRNYKQTSAIDWLHEEFDMTVPGAWSQVGKSIVRFSRDRGQEPLIVPDSKYGEVKKFHVDVISAFRLELRRDLNLLGKYRRRASQ